MPQLRNLLGRKPTAPDNEGKENNATTQTRLSVDSQRSGPLNFRKSREEVPNEYKLCVVNDSGVYLPPSPPEKQSLWRRYPSSPGTSKHRNLVDENEPFSISRESFDSYRRSFDISAKSPVTQPDGLPSRTSFDSRVSSQNGRLYVENTLERPQSMEEETFEDVGLGDDDIKPRKKGLFARFSDNSSDSNANNNRPSSTHLGFRLPGRKRGQSGQGAELGSFESDSHTTET